MSTPQRLVASWYRDRSQPASGLYAAIRSFRWGMAPYRVTVCGVRCITVTVRDHCATRGRIDLSPAAFTAVCGPLSKGICPVSIRRG